MAALRGPAGYGGVARAGENSKAPGAEGSAGGCMNLSLQSGFAPNTEERSKTTPRKKQEIGGRHRKVAQHKDDRERSRSATTLAAK